MSDMNVNTEVKCREESSRLTAFFQVDDIREMLGISRASAYELTKKKGFPCIKVGSRLVIPADLFNEWVVKTAVKGRC